MEAQGIYTIKDLKAEKYSRPFVQANDACGVREFHRSIRHELGDIAEDFELYKLGQWHEAEGLIEQFEKPQFMLAGQMVTADG